VERESWLTVVALPPIESFSSDQEVEDKAEDEPEGVLSCFRVSGHSAFVGVRAGLLVFAGGMLPAALKKMGTLINLIHV
jgi:hypothetical protein